MTSELLREIRENSEVREEARRLILTDELLEQPEVVKEVVRAQGQVAKVLERMAGVLDRMDRRQDRMDRRQGRMDRRQDRMDRRQDRMDRRLDNDLGELKGSVVENKAERRMQQLAPFRYGLHSPSVVAGEVAAHGPTQQFLEACRKAKATQPQIDSLNETDLIIRARRGTDGASAPVYVAVEVAYALDSGDIARVDETTRILRALAPRSNEPDAEVVGAVYGVRISEDDRNAAEKLGIGVFTEMLRR